MSRLGIIQGRLLPPVKNRIQAFPAEHWREEFSLCRQLGIACLEWIFEHETAEMNPLSSDPGIQEMLRVQEQYGVLISSVLADYFMVKRLFGKDKMEVKEAVDTLNFLIVQCHKCHIPIVEIPFVDSSALRTAQDREDVVHNLKEPLKYAQRYGIQLSLETSLTPREFKEFICVFASPFVKVNYDMGNSASLGYDPKEEIGLLGEYIANVHIKDRIKCGGTVPLGSGNTDFRAVFKALKDINYAGDFMLQGARQDLKGSEAPKDIKETINAYISFVRPFLKEFA